MLAVVLLLSAVVAYFMSSYGVVFDRSMIANMADTHTAEALELLSPQKFVWLLVFGVAPTWLVARVRIARQPWHLHLLGKAITLSVLHDDLTRLGVPALCAGDECYDEILLHGLQEKLDTFDRDAVLVLHMKGSHGPAYYLRYPPAFEHFVPVCRTNQFDRWQRETIVNAYDNTLRYTDHVLALTIDLLRRNADRFDTSLVYVSDHGESLGERGLYLHGVPYALAPPEQTHVPMLMWFSPSAQQRFGIAPIQGRTSRKANRLIGGAEAL